MAGFHHVEIWVADLTEVRRDRGWLLQELGLERMSEWSEGESWSASGPYLTFTTSPNLSAAVHDRRAPGVNHLASNGGGPSEVDDIMSRASDHGWHPLYADRYPHAGGQSHYAGWLENAAGFKVEIVADES